MPAALLDPLPHELCPMPEGIRGSYLLTDSDVRKAADPILIEHPDFMYKEFLTLPLDF